MDKFSPQAIELTKVVSSMQPTNNPLALAKHEPAPTLLPSPSSLRPLSNFLDNGWCAGGYWLTQTPLAVPRVHEPIPVINMIVCPIPQHMSTLTSHPIPCHRRVNPNPNQGPCLIKIPNYNVAPG